MTQQEMLLLVPRRLKQLETEYGIRVLYAAESGSRAWGTSHHDSDFDVRFIYIRPREDYLRLDRARDVLEFPIGDGWDMCGWDLTKTLQLLHNSNSQIYEWFHSPVVYVDGGFSRRFRPVLEAYFSTRTAVYHYLHQAELKMKKLQKDDTVKVKHYLYSLQHLAAAQWVLERHAPVPVDFGTVTQLLPPDVRQQAGAIALRKTTRPEQPGMPRDPQLDAWLREEYSRLHREAGMLPGDGDKGWERLNRFFLEELEENEKRG